MSNLIDRQAAIKVASKRCHELRGVFGEIEEGLKELPTVDAIPIEWIEKWFSQFYGEQGLEWNRCKRFMLDDWEKENEKG